MQDGPIQQLRHSNEGCGSFVTSTRDCVCEGNRGRLERRGRLGRCCTGVQAIRLHSQAGDMVAAVYYKDLHWI